MNSLNYKQFHFFLPHSGTCPTFYRTSYASCIFLHLPAPSCTKLTAPYCTLLHPLYCTILHTPYCNLLHLPYCILFGQTWACFFALLKTHYCNGPHVIIKCKKHGFSLVFLQIRELIKNCTIKWKTAGREYYLLLILWNSMEGAKAEYFKRRCAVATTCIPGESSK